MKEFLVRTLTGLLYVLIIIGSVYYNERAYLGLNIVIGFLGCNETIKLLRKSGSKPDNFTALFISLLILSWSYAYLTNLSPKLYTGISGILFLAIIILFVGFLFIQELFSKKAHPLDTIGSTFLAIIYPSTFILFLMWVPYAYTGDYNPDLIMGIFILMWSSDTGAYLAGKTMGKRKLYPRISPGKTWQGSIGGLLLSVGLGFVISYYFNSISLLLWIILAVVVTVFGTLGDLVESMIKRNADAKDSGKLLPGHGGVLDRFDSLLFASPFIFVVLVLFQLIQQTFDSV